MAPYNLDGTFGKVIILGRPKINNLCAFMEISRTLGCSPSVTVCSCVGLGLGTRVRARNRV